MIPLRRGTLLSLNNISDFQPVEVEDVVEDLRVPVEEELVAVHDVVVTQIQLPAVVFVRGQLPDPCLWILGC